MIILPDRNIPRAKFLLPVSHKEWREPSQRVERDQFGNLTQQTRFRIKAKTHDGVVLWTGWFDDREDFDAFLYAIALGTINKEPALWDLPSPSWPQLDPGLLFATDTVTFLTSTSVSTYNIPSDWNHFSNKIEAVGAGGKGGLYSGGSGGGAYASITNTAGLTGAISYRAGTQGGTTGSGTTPTTNSYFKDGSTLVAAGGVSATHYYTNPGAGGTTTNSVGTVKYAGGTGGTYLGTNNGTLGGGGAAGPHGAGETAPDSGQYGSGVYGGPGGAGDNGFGGAGGATKTTSGAGNPGESGTEWDSSHGCGGGGSGVMNGAGQPGGAGGSYGAGAGGSPGNDGGSGLIVITYKPIRGGLNMPFLGL